MSSDGPTASDLLALWVSAFAARRTGVAAPGVTGTLGSAEDPYARLLVTDDRAEPFLAALDGPAIAIVLDAAPRCTARLADWGETTPIALMVRPELETLPDLALDLEVRDDVPLEDMVRLVDDPDVVLGLLGRSRARFFAAVDGDGVVRATSGSAVHGEDASVMFVNTDPAWRGRGIGTAMTALALRDARERGARRACLTATAAGQGIYARLGFSVAASAVELLPAPDDDPGLVGQDHRLHAVAEPSFARTSATWVFTVCLAEDELARRSRRSSSPRASSSSTSRSRGGQLVERRGAGCAGGEPRDELLDQRGG